MSNEIAPDGAGATRTLPAEPDPRLLDAAAIAVGAKTERCDGAKPDECETCRGVRAEASAAVRATGEWLAERLEDEAEQQERALRATVDPNTALAVIVSAKRGIAAAVRRLCGVPAPGAPDMCHNGHRFEPGIDLDAPTIPDPRWCNVCGEARRLAPGAPEGSGS